MTDEQKQRYRESEKRYRKNMTDEQKQKQREAIKNHQKNIGKNIEKLKSDKEKI